MMLWTRMRERNPDFLRAESRCQARKGPVMGKDKVRRFIGDGVSLSQWDINCAPSIPDRRKWQTQISELKKLIFLGTLPLSGFSKNWIKPEHLHSVHKGIPTARHPETLRSSCTDAANSWGHTRARWQPAPHRVGLSFILQSQHSLDLDSSLRGACPSQRCETGSHTGSVALAPHILQFSREARSWPSFLPGHGHCTRRGLILLMLMPPTLCPLDLPTCVFHATKDSWGPSALEWDSHLRHMPLSYAFLVLKGFANKGLRASTVDWELRQPNTQAQLAESLIRRKGSGLPRGHRIRPEVGWKRLQSRSLLIRSLSFYLMPGKLFCQVSLKRLPRRQAHRIVI